MKLRLEEDKRRERLSNDIHLPWAALVKNRAAAVKVKQSPIPVSDTQTLPQKENRTQNHEGRNNAIGEAWHRFLLLAC